MFDAETGPSRVQHPLEVLAEIEQQGTVDQELLLRDGSTQWGEVLADYVDALNALAAHEPHADAGIPRYGLDEGHAGGPKVWTRKEPGRKERERGNGKKGQ